MANTVNIKLNLSDDGSISAASERVKGLNRELAQSKKLAAAGFMQEGEGQSYGVARGAVGTGAAGRDFAKQAQGLGGLVHVYATFAANLFAVGAAFRALSQAADTTNMVRGMDQLGAASGQALGSLAKNITQVTDGAISMRDAMEATTKATAAGMSTKQIGQMAEVAKKASQALGISMPDALSRLSRGISKLEPELLDELGIFTKLEASTVEYARSIGKSTATLTDFERRQAFATAVLKEGLDKFGAIDMQANPYDKLLASMKNLAQTGLELVNKILTPIVKVLSESPMALGAVLAGIATMLLSRALPALGQFREGLRQSAIEAVAAAEKFKDSFGDEFQSRLERRFKLPDLQDSVRKAENSLNRMQVPDRLAKSVSSLAKAQEADPRLLQNVNEVLDRKNKLIDTGMRGSRQASAEQIAAAKQEKTYIEAVIALYQKKLALKQADAKAQDVADKPLSRLDPQIVALRKYEQLRDKVTRSELVSNASQNAQILGIKGAWAELNREIDEKGVKGANRFSTLLSGGLAAVGSRVMGIISAFSTFGVIAAAIGTAWGIIDSGFSKANKEVDAFNSSLEMSKEATENLDRTMMSLSRNRGMTTEGIQAVATAYNEMAQALQANVDKATDFNAKAEGWDKGKQWIKSLFGADISTQLAKDISTRIGHAFDVAPDSETKAAFAKRIQDLLGTENVSGFTIIKDVGSDEMKAKSLLKIFQEFSKEVNNSASRMTELKNSLDLASKAAQDLSNSFIPSDAVGKLGLALFDVSKKMVASMDKPLEQFRELNEIVKDTSRLALFSPAVAMNMAAQSTSITQLASNLASTQANIAQYQTELTNAQRDLAYEEKKSSISDRTIELRKKVAALTDALTHLKSVDKNMQADTKQYADLFRDAQIDAAKRGAALISASIQMAFDKAALSLEKSRATGWTGMGAADEELRITKKEISIQQQQIDAQIANTRTMKELVLQLESDALTRKLKEEPDKAEEINRQLGIVKQQQDFFKSNATFKDITGILKSTTQPTDVKEAAAAYAPYASQIAGFQGQTAQNKANKAIAEETARTKRQQEMLNEYVTGEYTTQKNILTTEQSRLQVLAQLNQGYTSGYDIAISNNKIAQMDLDNEKASLEYITKYVTLLQKTGTETERRNLTQKELAREQDFVNRRGLEYENTLKLRQLDRYQSEKIARDNRFQSEQQVLQFREQDIGLAKEYLNIQSSLGKITDEEAEAKKRSLDRQALENSYTLESLRLTNERAAKLADIQLKIDQTPAGGNTKYLEDAKTAANAYYDAQAVQLDKVNSKKRENLLLDQSMSLQMKGFSKVVEDTFGRLGDALAEFTKTGKLNFKDLINGMLLDLLRFEMKAQTSALYKSMGGLSGMVTSVSDFFNGNSAGRTMYDQGLNQMAPQAKGGVWDAGVQMFARGGSFTNGIVNSPTLFKFAQGTGMMGEAGPEAIMPLKRDGQGNLGVRANAQKTEVVVNNYSNSQATAKETVDSRGNRRIEVVIGEIVASEIGRPGSAVQQSFSNNFNARPAIARR
jgi:hypothetical protein